MHDQSVMMIKKELIDTVVKVEEEEPLNEPFITPSLSKPTFVETQCPLLCFLCQKSGHLTSQCPELRCKVCNARGHAAYTCKRAQQTQERREEQTQRVRMRMGVIAHHDPKRYFPGRVAKSKRILSMESPQKMKEMIS